MTLSAREQEMLTDIASESLPNGLLTDPIAQFAAMAHYVKTQRPGTKESVILMKLAVNLHQNHAPQQQIVLCSTRRDMRRLFLHYETFYGWGSRYYYWSNQDMVQVYQSLQLLVARRSAFIARIESLDAVNKVMSAIVEYEDTNERHICRSCDTPSIPGRKCPFCNYHDKGVH